MIQNIKDIIEQDIAGNLKKIPHGVLLKQMLGLKYFPYVWIQRTTGYAVPIYIVTFDSRNANRYLSLQKVRSLKSMGITGIKRQPAIFLRKNIKMTMPQNIDYFQDKIPSHSVIIFRDIAGEYFYNKNNFSENCITFQGNKIKVYQ